MRILRSLAVLLFAAMPIAGFAQYYDLGQSPASIHWRSIKNKHIRVIYPDYYFAGATRVFRALDTVRPYINYGFRYGPMRTPVVMHTQNYYSNGLVLLAPRRMEFIMNPLGSNTATPWFKQLAVHEFRHAVQFNNTNRNFIRALSYVLGQQGSLVGGVILPNWLMEGDAVLAETQMTSFGRGLQPSFTIEYRAMMGEGVKRYAVDKYFCGSYKDYMPDHYQLGYQIASYSDTRYGENVWDKVADYGSKYPFFILTTKFSLHKYYRTSVNKLFRATMDDLQRYWASLPVVNNSATILDVPTTSYTTYSSPVQVDSTTVLAFKKDLDRTDRIVAFNPVTGKERVIRYTGRISSDPVYADGRLYWTEYRNSTFWEQRTHSVLRSYNLAADCYVPMSESRKALYAAPINGADVAYVEYQNRGNYKIVSPTRTWELPDSVSVHGLAYNEPNSSLYFLATSDAGMWIGRCVDNGSGFEVVTRPSFATLSKLKAADGSLYYNSIESGKDEVYKYDIASGRQYRISTSRYGSFDVMPSVDGKSFAMTTYADSKRGYLLAVQPNVADSLHEVAYSMLPSDRINPPRRKWDVMNIDTVRIDSIPEQNISTKRYRKSSHLVSVHSWAPMGFDPSGLVSENDFRIYAGATVMSQNTLASMVGQVSYSWTDKGSQLAGKIAYLGLAPKFDVDFVWGGADQYLAVGAIPPTLEKLPPIGKLKKNFEVTLRSYLPITLSSGYVGRVLTPMVELYHDNSLLLRRSLNSYSHTGVQRMTASLTYSANVRMAYRDFLPKLGYAVRLSYICNPARSDFGNIWSMYMRGYLPGVAAHHSLMLRSSLQYQNRDYYNYRRRELYPRGALYTAATHRYMAFAGDYQLPLCYPDVGITSILHLKRIRLNLATDYARFRSVQSKYHTVWSYGGELIFDIAPLRLPPSTSTAISISIFRPSNRKGIVVEGGLSLPI